MKVHPSTAKSWARRFYAGDSVQQILFELDDDERFVTLATFEIRQAIEQAIRDYTPTEAERKEQRAKERQSWR